MLKVLLKKQLAEVFRSYFYNAKKNELRSKGSMILWFLFFAVLMVGVLGGTFTFISVSMCAGLSSAGAGWLYFALMSGIAITLGTFGSVFNTYSGLYLPKDNDLLLSMPIPVRTIIIARLVNVYLLGTMYSSVVLLPALIVYWIVVGVTVPNLICGILLFLIVSVIVLTLSCALGWIVAKISLKLKNKSFITVLISLAFIGVYYFAYFKAQDWIRDLIANAEEYGSNIKSSAYIIYFYGRIGEGDLIAAAVFTAAAALILALVIFIISRGFLKLATSSGSVKKVRYKEKKAREKSTFTALLGKEFSRFTSSPNYMLNCGLGVLLLPASGVLLLIKGRDLAEILSKVFGGGQSYTCIIMCAALMMISTMNDMTAPSVALEGKSIWIPQSLPVEAKTVLKAKTAMQVILTGIPMLAAVICAAVVVGAGALETLMMCLVPLLFTVFMALLGTVIGVRNPTLNWTSEVVPIKQSGSVMIALFGGWGFVILFAAPFFFIGNMIGAALYLAIWAVIYTAVSVILYRRMVTKGAKTFSQL